MPEEEMDGFVFIDDDGGVERPVKKATAKKVDEPPREGPMPPHPYQQVQHDPFYPQYNYQSPYYGPYYQPYYYYGPQYQHQYQHQYYQQPYQPYQYQTPGYYQQPQYYRPPPTPEQVELGKRFWINPFVIIGVFLLAMVVTVIVSLPVFLFLALTATNPLELVSSPTVLLIFAVVQNLVLALFVWMLYIKKGVFSLREMGVHLDNIERNLVIGLVIGGLVFAMGAFLIPVIQEKYMPEEVPESGEDILMQHLDDPANVVIILVVISVVAPLGEEFFFRGIAFNAAKAYFQRAGWGRPLLYALIYSSVFFALVHVYGITGSIVVGVLGALLAYMTHYTNSLVAPMLIHGLYNAGILTGALVF